MAATVFREPRLGAESLSAAIRKHAIEHPDYPAILSPRREALSYAALDRAVVDIGTALRSAGIQERSVVGLALPHGPELALAIAAVACHAVAVPLNPAATLEELS